MKPTDKTKLKTLVIGIVLLLVVSPLIFTMGGPTKETVDRMADSIFQMRDVAASIEDPETAKAALPRMKKIVAEMEEMNERAWKWYFAREELEAEILRRDATARMKLNDFIRLEATVAYGLQERSAQSKEEFWPILQETIRAYDDQVRLVNQSAGIAEVGIRLLVLVFVLQWILKMAFASDEPEGRRRVYRVAAVALAMAIVCGVYRTYQDDWATLAMVVYASVCIAIGLAIWRAIWPGKTGDNTDENPVEILEAE